MDVHCVCMCRLGLICPHWIDSTGSFAFLRSYSYCELIGYIFFLQMAHFICNKKSAGPMSTYCISMFRMGMCSIFSSLFLMYVYIINCILTLVSFYSLTSIIIIVIYFLSILILVSPILGRKFLILQGWRSGSAIECLEPLQRTRLHWPACTPESSGPPVAPVPGCLTTSVISVHILMHMTGRKMCTCRYIAQVCKEKFQFEKKLRIFIGLALDVGFI